MTMTLMNGTVVLVMSKSDYNKVADCVTACAFNKDQDIRAKGQEMLKKMLDADTTYKD